jgi:hypothetical protein
LKSLKNSVVTACPDGRPLKEKKQVRLGDSMGNSAAFPVIVAKGYAPIGFRW